MSSSSLLLKTVPLVVANKSVPLELIADNFTFDNDITPAQIGMLRERHRFAFSRIASCGSLSDNERDRLVQAYQRDIRHSTLNEAGVNARATINGSRIWVNFGVLFPQGPREIAQTLIHEMMHCAGFTHPDRQPTDSPGDNGPYYGTPPLQAELCIAGVQSDKTCTAETEGCTIRS